MEIKQESVLKESAQYALPMLQLNKEVKSILPFVDTISNGWITINDTANATSRLPVLFYKSKRSLNQAQLTQLYSYLLVRLSKDTVVLMKKR